MVEAVVDYWQSSASTKPSNSTTYGRVHQRGTSSLYYEVFGNGPPLLLVHGLGASQRWWARNVPVLAQYFTVYTVDLIGFGRSCRGNQRFVLTEAATVLHNWLLEQRLTNVSLVGHSMGGRIGVELAVDYPGSVSRLVLVDSPVLPFGRGYLRQLLGMVEALWVVPLDLLPLLIVDTLRTGFLTTLQIGCELMQHDIVQKLAQLQRPTLVIWGARDTIVPQRMGRQLATQLEQDRFVALPSVGHVPMWEQPDAFNQLVLAFLVEGDVNLANSP